jgi:hypothetical protein
VRYKYVSSYIYNKNLLGNSIKQQQKREQFPTTKESIDFNKMHISWWCSCSIYFGDPPQGEKLSTSPEVLTLKKPSNPSPTCTPLVHFFELIPLVPLSTPQPNGLLYGYWKVDKDMNFQPTKAHLNVCFLFSHQSTSWVLIKKMFQQFRQLFSVNIFKMLQHF